MKQGELRSLVERIKHGKCVLVLGPRVAVRADDPERRPLDELLARELLTDIGVSEQEIGLSAANLRRAADRYAEHYGDPYVLTTFAHDFYTRQAETTTEFHRDLASLPFRLCITASPDDLMSVAFRSAGKTPQRGHYNFKGGRMPPLAQPTAEHPLVYHLFGHSSDPASLVLTEVDLIRFLVAVIKGAPPIPDQVRGILNDPGVSCLFVGFGFHQWYLRVLLEVMNLHKSSRGTAFEDSDFFERPDSAEVVGFFSGTRRIDFWPLQWETFARELRQRYEATVQRAPASADAATLPADAPIAFVSYASEDRAIVDTLVDELEKQGIDVWQDRLDLRAGQKWRKALKDVIEEQVHYVIVVQTEAMLRREEGVFYTEIELAKERQSRMRDDVTFVIPVTVGHCGMLPALEEYHGIDVSDASGTARLAAAIRQDWQKRAARRQAVA